MTPSGPRRPWSATPAPEDVERARGAWESPPPELPGIDLNVEQQLDLLQEFGRAQADVRLPASPDRNGWRYYFENAMYRLGDALVLYGVIRHLSPSRIIEIGSGFSSALMLDINERCFDWGIECTIIDPLPRRLKQLARPGDFDRVSVIEHWLQDVDLSVFESLRPADILFIDSSHVSKMGSDVNHLFFEVIPRLPVGAWIHFHDISYPFEYSPASVEDRRAWSEAYLLRAFLEHNGAFRICFFFDYLRRFHRDAVERALPGSIASGSTHIWLERAA